MSIMVYSRPTARLAWLAAALLGGVLSASGMFVQEQEKAHNGAFRTALSQGREFDSHAGHYFFRNRIYFPEWGQFATPDMNMQLGPVGEPYGLASIVFCGNSPLVQVDPWGYEESPAISWFEGRKNLSSYAVVACRLSGGAFNKTQYFPSRIRVDAFLKQFADQMASDEKAPIDVRMAAINGNFFRLFGNPKGRTEIYGFVGQGHGKPWVGSGKHEGGNAGMRWGFGIQGARWGIARDVENPAGTLYLPASEVQRFPYGMNNVYAIMMSGNKQEADPDYPDRNNPRCRSILAWGKDAAGDVYSFMLVVGYRPGDAGLRPDDAASFLKQVLEIDSAKTLGVGGMGVNDAVMLDGGTSSQMGFIHLRKGKIVDMKMWENENDSVKIPGFPQRAVPSLFIGQSFLEGRQ